jgi:diguanylate cyclase (GGDEF)-like protein
LKIDGMPSQNPIRRDILRVFFILSLLLSVFLAITLYQAWPDHPAILVYELLTFLIIGWLFFRLYRQASMLDKSNFKSTHDALTGLSNRRAIDDVFERLWRESMREQSPISVLFMDIDHFKIVNDTYGHETGDRVLQAVASAIQSQLNRPLDLCCRWGGEEFVAVLPRTDEQGALKIANDIMSAIHALKVIQGDTAIDRVSISIGVASVTVNADNVRDDLIDMADKAMFKAKLEGRNRVVVYRPGLHQ